MKINRLSNYESYKVTADWLKEFCKKQAYSERKSIADILGLTNNVEKFSSVEDKMQNIKSRVGFDKVKKLSKDKSVQKSASNSKKSIDKKDVQKVQKILDYIRDMARDRPYISAPAIMSDVRDNPSLGLDGLNINIDKLYDYIKEFTSDDIKVYTQDSVYTPLDLDDNIGYEDSDDIAEYYRHSTPDSQR